MTRRNHSHPDHTTRDANGSLAVRSADAVVAAYIHEISARRHPPRLTHENGGSGLRTRSR